MRSAAIFCATLALSSSSCFDERYPCATDAQCQRSGLKGACMATATTAKYCAFPDSACRNGWRWDPTAAKGLGGTCADETCGQTATPCPDGRRCRENGDCMSRHCDPGTRTCTSRCDDKVQNGQETDVDCGGGTCGVCGKGEKCQEDDDCFPDFICDPNPMLRRCVDRPTCVDKQQNGTETDVDCGGDECPKCGQRQRCRQWSDCATGECVGFPGPPRDGGVGDGGAVDGAAKDGGAVDGGAPRTKGTCDWPVHCDNRMEDEGETDVDCGGTCAQCKDQRRCSAPTDCLSKNCTNRRCVSACDDKIKNGTESDVDCGTDCGMKCQLGKRCLKDTDCQTGKCDGLFCVKPPCENGKQDGDESDLDCGGKSCPKCAAGKKCSAGEDCASGVCANGMCK